MSLNHCSPKHRDSTRSPISIWQLHGRTARPPTLFLTAQVAQFGALDCQTHSFHSVVHKPRCTG